MRRVLLVDDEPVLLTMLGVNFRAEGFDVTTASTGAEAVAASADAIPDAIVLDLGLPDADGWDVLERLRATDGLADVPVVVVSGTDVPEDARYARGVHACLTKPVTPADLVAAVRRALGG